jgi:hypothetical protein
MPETLTGTNNFNNQIEVPKDNLGEPRNAASLQPAFQKVLDNTKNLDIRVTALLNALNNLVVLNSDDDTAILSAVQAINAHVIDVTDAHALSSISYAGNPASGLPASDAEVALDAIADRIKALEISPIGQVGKGVRRNGTVSIAAFDGGVVPLNNVPPDGFSDAGFWSNTNPERITIPADGRYQVSLVGGFGFAANGNLSVRIKGLIKGVLNDSSIFANDFADGTKPGNLVASGVIELLQGDYLTVQGINSGSVTATYFPVVSVVRIG